MSESYIALGGMVIATLSLVGASILRDRQIFQAIKDGDDNVQKSVNNLADVVRLKNDDLGHRINSSSEKVHIRVNECLTRNELNGKLVTMQSSIENVSTRVDNILTLMATKK